MSEVPLKDIRLTVHLTDPHDFTERGFRELFGISPIILYNVSITVSPRTRPQSASERRGNNQDLDVHLIDASSASKTLS